MLCLVACQAPNNPTKVASVDTELDKGKVTFYGAYYAEEGLNYNVLDLDLLSEHLSYDSLGHIVGTGTNLYFSDIFLSPTDSLLQEGIYTADTIPAERTFLPGMNYEGGVSGAYLLQIVDNQVSRIILIDKGTFHLTQEGDTTHIAFDLVTDTKQAYKGTFHGVL